MRRRSVVQILITLVAIALLTPQLTDLSNAWRSLVGANPYWVLGTILTMALALMFATLVYVFLVPVKMPFSRTLLVQLATYFTNRLLPSGLGGIGFNALYLVKQARYTRTDAAVYATANNLIGFLAFTIISALVLFISDLSLDVGAVQTRYLLLGAVLIIVITAVLLGIRKVQRKLFNFMGHLFSVLLGIWRSPWRLLGATLASCGITTCYVLTLWASAQALNVEATLAQILIAFIVGNIALTFVPTPGGVGAVEAGIVAVLISFSVSSEEAIATTLIFRLISYWLPIVPGYISFRYVTRRGYV
jgi:uncharacterized membrane protein YbhN (UPF0104 family)